ncbi:MULTISPECIES: hypothetical protein [unclassified Methylophaga]|jgi:hypothetical protein|uniref:hypothetical protein n=1 Tax=unclassified Methylophaga TaxID=2629249 RepID=UPI000C8D0B91|nr:MULTISPECIES: hypothetical protein [unclassified Methylophaga]MAK65405.1 hypothetical protein [Methylophaga sp.]MAY16129.1 hypothetical protein [Methylophaga sp.]MBN47698.1 hypothetical protein [Methylophaga sp.]HAO26052.1 hypothetical protein [Methylophaga sp.]|tara:strand:+ start:3300 stop:4232 length:933 start_codon:yes stop_codon:yes gene_type:complete
MAEKPSVTIIWPGLATVMQEINQSLVPEALQKLFKKANFTVSDNSFEHELIQLFSTNMLSGPDLPTAQLRNPGQLSLCADPCYLHADRDRLLLFPITDLTMEEGTQLRESIQPLLNDFDAQLVPNDLNHWSIWLETMPDINLTAMSSLIGKSVASALPKGAEQNDWLRLSNEIQMVLFEHPVNQQRQSAGKLPVNSLWFWGKADWQPQANTWQQLYGDAALLKSLASATSTSLQPMTEWKSENTMTGQQLLVFPELDLQSNWPQRLEQNTTQHILPLLRKLRRYQIRQLRLIIPQHGQYVWRCWDVWKPW